jgi:hypothetical protein
MSKFPVLSCALAAFLLTACRSGPACPAPLGTLKNLTPSELGGSPPSVTTSSPAEIEIGGRMTRVDQVISGPLCSGRWKGTVYVTCDVKVLEWKEQPLFLKGCDLTIEPGTVVYVAAHHDAPYYNGCSCHTGTDFEH